jgi:hypothetical protein
LVAIDGSDASNRAFAKAVELPLLTKAQLIARSVEGRLPACAATIGEVDEVKRERIGSSPRRLSFAAAQAESAARRRGAHLRRHRGRGARQNPSTESKFAPEERGLMPDRLLSQGLRVALVEDDLLRFLP